MEQKKKLCCDYQEIPMSMMVRLFYIQRKKKKVFNNSYCDISLGTTGFLLYYIFIPYIKKYNISKDKQRHATL